MLLLFCRPSCIISLNAPQLLVLISLLWQVRLCSGLSIKSMQIWSQVDSNGNLLPLWDPETYAGSLVKAWNVPLVADEADTSDTSSFGTESSGVGARAAISRWTSIGCFSMTQEINRVAMLSRPGLNPLLCKDMCEAEPYQTHSLPAQVAVMRGSTCYCLRDRENMERAETVRCDFPCANYFNRTTRFCGGKGEYYWAYQRYDYVHSTSQGCYDPWRFLWYQSVALDVRQVTTVNGVSIWTTTQEYYLHASSINNGDPVFPYHEKLDSMLMGLQYDLDDSRLVGWVAPTWNQKVDSTTSWNPFLEVYKIRSLNDQVTFTKEALTFSLTGSSAASYLFSTGVSAIDAIENMYYIILPSVPEIADPNQNQRITPRVPLYSSKLYGINLDGTSGAVEILEKTLPWNVVLLEANAKYHDLFALFQGDESTTRGFYYSRLGHSYRNNRTNALEFNWTFKDPFSSVVNPYNYGGWLDKYYQVGVSTVDHLSNKSLLVYKDLPNADAPLVIGDIDQHGFLVRTIDATVPSPAVQGTWLVNTDPLIPLTLPAPKLLYARFTLDGQGIIVQFDSFTIEGALPLDTDGDFIPDDIDWGAKQEGMRNCSDMFARQTATLLKDARCAWTSPSTISIYVSVSFEDLLLGDGIFLKDSTIYAYVSATNEWSNAASGGVEIGLPDPLPPPTIDVSYPSSVDLCTGVILNAEKSYGYGGRPIWTWSLKGDPTCTAGRPPTTSITEAVQRILLDASKNGLSPNGVDLVEFSRDDMEPGCTYTINVKLLGRWLKESDIDLIITKREVPAPQVSMIGPRHVHQFRSKKIVLQASVGASACDSQLLELRTLKFEWRASVSSVNQFSGALEQLPVDLEQLNIITESSLIILPKLRLQPEADYTLTVTVGYVETWDVAGTRTEEQVMASIMRSPIKVNVLGGSRKVPKTAFVAIDARSSFDPDYPDELIENDPAWSFAYSCTTADGGACFPSTDTAALPDVKTCQLSEGQVFRDLSNTYSLPSFPSTALTSDSYYCKDATKNGVLILNLRSTEALPAGNNYTFTVTGMAHGRIAESSISLQVTFGEFAAPRVFITPLDQPKVSITQRLRIQGGLLEEDYDTFVDTAVFSWSFWKEEANPRYTGASTTDGQLNPTIFAKATELTLSSLASAPTSNNLVIKAGQLLASTAYRLRLSATAPHPYGGEPLVGYTDLSLLTAGPAPVPGSLKIFPAGESYVDEEKTLKAEEWTAEDVPLTYMFSYKVGLTDEFPNLIQLQAESFNSPTQYVKCFKAGKQVDNYMVQVNVTVTSNFGASSWLTQLYKSKPPIDEVATNTALLALSEQVDDHTATTVLNCISIREVDTSASAADNYTCGEVASGDCIPEYDNALSNGNLDAFCNRCATESGTNAFRTRCPVCCQECLTTSTTTTTLPFEQSQEDSSEVEQMVEVMTSSVQRTAATSSSVKAKLAIADDILRKGHQPSNMLNLLSALTDQVNELALSGDQTSEEVDEMLQSVFTTFGQYGLSATGLGSDTVDPLNAATAGFSGASDTNARRLRRQMPHRGRELHPRANGRPDWHKVPLLYRDPAYFPAHRARRGRSLAGDANSGTSAESAQQEQLEQEWISYINATMAVEAYTEQQAALDDEYFANYSAHLGVEERTIVTREWWQERARKESEAAEKTYTQSKITHDMLKHMSDVCATLVKQMVPGENQKDFNFPMGTISVGKTRDLINNAEASFHLQDSKWKKDSEDTGSYGYEYIQFSKVNPLAWDPDTPTGPYLVSSLEVFRGEGTAIPVARELQPIAIMDNSDTFASASCYVWDWQANNGLGGWSPNGVLNNGRGCVTTHLSIVGLFLDVVASDDGIEFPSAVGEDFAKTVSEFNAVVVVALSGSVILCSLLHFWGLKQDEQDRTKPMEMKRLGDGISKPRSQDDPVSYSQNACARTCGTFWNLIRRDHNLISCFCRCPKMKTSRLQKVSVLFATITGTSAVCALFYGEHIISSKHYIEVGIIASVLTYPMIRMMRLMFSSRPYREAMPPNQSGIFSSGVASGEVLAPLQAIPVPLEEQDEDEIVPDRAFGVAMPNPLHPISSSSNPNTGVGVMPNPLNPNPMASSSFDGAPNMSPPRVNLSLPPVQAHSPAVSGGSGPDEGGGPLLLPATAQVLSGQAPAPPPPPAPASSSDGLPPLPPPSESPRAEMPSSALMRAVTEKLDSGDNRNDGDPLPPRAPPLPPISFARDNDEHPLALIPFSPPDESLGLSPILPPAAESGALEAAQSSAQVRSYNRVRRMIIEKVCNDAEKLAYDERIDMRSSVPHPMAHVATALAYTSVVSYWVTALILTLVYSVHLSSLDALRWLYACLFSWGFTWFVLEGVKTILVTILELQQLNQRRRLRDQSSLQRQVSMKKQLKLRQMEVLAKAAGVMPAPSVHPAQPMQRLPIAPSSSSVGSAARNFPSEGLEILPSSPFAPSDSQPASRGDESAG